MKLTWLEAEELFPECSPSWDRDVELQFDPVLVVYEKNNLSSDEPCKTASTFLRASDPDCNSSNSHFPCRCRRWDSDNKVWLRYS